jgi:hypothetical protein
MWFSHLLRSWFATLAVVTSLIVLACLVSIEPAMAQDSGRAKGEAVPDLEEASEGAETPEYSDYFTGAFVEYSVRGGASLASEADYDGWHIDAGVRHSFPMLLGDFRVAYRFDNLSEGGAGNPNALAPGPIEQHSVGGYLALHPAYLLMLGSDWLSYTLASIHLELGGGVRLGVLERVVDGEFEMGVGPFVSIGGGFDMPLADPDSGAAPWLNFVYRWHVADFDGAVETYDIDMHVVQVGLGWRINGLMF